MITRKKNLKAGQLLEFTLLMPMIAILMTFSMDMGRLVIASTSLRDAVAVSARAGARVGYAGVVPTNSDCSNDNNSAYTSYHAFCQDATMLVGAAVQSFEVVSPKVGAENYCIYNNGANDLTNMYVVVKATAKLSFMTPGLSVAFNVTKDGDLRQDATITVTGAARCEVSR